MKKDEFNKLMTWAGGPKNVTVSQDAPKRTLNLAKDNEVRVVASSIHK